MINRFLNAIGFGGNIDTPNQFGGIDTRSADGQLLRQTMPNVHSGINAQDAQGNITGYTVQGSHGLHDTVMGDVSLPNSTDVDLSSFDCGDFDIDI